MWRKKANKTIIGLDIAASSIKMVQASKEAGKIRVLGFGRREFSASEANPDFLSRKVQELLGGIKELKRASIHAVVSGRKLIIRVVKLPVMPEGEISQAIKSMIRKYVSQDLEQLEFAFSVLGETQEKGIKKLDVAFMAIQKNLLNQYRQFFKLTGAEPQAVSSACFSEWNLIKKAGLDQDAASLMLIDIEAEQTDLAVYREGRFIFTRNISIGRRDLAKEQAQLSPEQAEVFSKEIEMTAHHYYQITHGNRIDKCILLGEGSQIAGLVDFLKQKLEIPVVNFFLSDAQLELPQEGAEEFKRNLPLYTQALGALLISPNDINLLVQERKQFKKSLFPAVKSFAFPRTAFAAGVIFASLLLSLFVIFKGTNLYYQHRIKASKIRREQLQGLTIKLMQIKRKADILDFEKKLYLQLTKERSRYPLIIARICQAIPSEKTVLDELSFNSIRERRGPAESLSRVQFNIQGRVLGQEALNQETTNFVLALEQSGYFDNISVSMNEEMQARGQVKEEIAEHLGFAVNGIVRLED